ncbi:50S ribosomal protein L29 [Enteractinococcus fodinae]|uniref:Large ribosomal subunit protein uL29 n=1 Tax=Enteractinococcus fodinae TaxID=684663 RepID=A0ABU2B135_9MICC|nr:50S ribosomal protein L29 [Enteractinococcus fodinae]MDR7346473.1 large subunit ribosomal protein L29 [Enteractinococcus fodinae]
MALGSPELSTDALDGFDNARLREELDKAKAELFNLRFQAATGQLDNSGRIKVVKRDVARIMTVLRERDLGIRQEVEASEEDIKDKKKSRK